MREGGNFSTVSVQWRVFEADTLVPAVPLDDFEVVAGSVVFQDGQAEAYIELAVIADGTPELVEEFLVQLVDVTVLGDSFIEPRIDLEASNSSLSIAENDDPYGLFAFSSDSQSVEVAEDVPIDNSFSDLALLNVTREKGTFGTVSV